MPTDYQSMSIAELRDFILANPAYKVSMALRYYKGKKDKIMVDKIMLARQHAQVARLELKLDKLRG